jgi:hypothetical protein
MRSELLAIGLLLGTLNASAEERFDVVIQGGRLVDPETGLDAIQNVGVRADRIAIGRVDGLHKSYPSCATADRSGFVPWSQPRTY